MKYHSIFNKFFDLSLLGLFTYSSSILMLAQRFYNEILFVELAFLFSLFVGGFTLVGGSIRMLEKNNIQNKDVLNSIFIMRLCLCIFLGIVLFLSNLHYIIIAILLRRTIEWTVDPIITFLNLENKLHVIFIILLDITSLCFLLLNYEQKTILILWIILPLLHCGLIFLKCKIKLDFTFKIENFLNFSFKNYMFVLGFEGPSALTSIVFRYFINLYKTPFLVDALFFTVILSFIGNFFVKILFPTFKNFNLPKFITKNKFDTLLFICLIFSILISIFLAIQYHYSLIYLFSISFILQFFALLMRKKIIQMSELLKILYIEIIISISLIFIMFINVFFGNFDMLGWYYLVNAILNWTFYKNAISKYNF